MTDSTPEGMVDSMTEGQNGKHGMNGMQRWMEYCDTIQWDVKQNP